MATPLLKLAHARREYPSGDGVFAALKALDLTIDVGEMVAIVGASGSGKSTLMNILGCLDRPTAGRYEVGGQDTAGMNPDALAALRRERFGFIFQRYNLLPDLTALENVEVPAIYAGQDRKLRHERAKALLTRLKLHDRLDHRPTQLSGGQQQRVSIARALMNGGEIILADEPTGALDSHVGDEVLTILRELHAEGHTIVMVTHDPKVAQHAERIVELSDGQIIADHQTSAAGTSSQRRGLKQHDRRGSHGPRMPPLWGLWDRAAEALRMAFLAMSARRLRTFLTMLGIIIGVASVASVVALGQGGEQRVLSYLRRVGTNTIEIYPGKDYGDEKAASVRTLTPTDADAIAEQGHVDSVTPTVSTTSSLRFGNVSLGGSIHGVGEDYFRVHNIELARGHSFSQEDRQRLAQVVVIDENPRQKLFVNGEDPVGQVIFLGAKPFRVIGVAKRKDVVTFGPNQNLHVWVPYTAVMGRMLGQRYLTGITARVAEDVPTDLVADAVAKLLIRRHGLKDFYIVNTDTVRKVVEATTRTLTLLIASIALISLVVGGIGVMNIMLVSVTERTREIGVRTAVGARRSDILQQFLIEGVLVCLIGGALGVALALGFGFAFPRLISDFPMIFSVSSIAAAVAVSTVIGVVFGLLPARNAARLDPVEALASE